MVRSRVVAGAALIAAVVFCGASYGWTCAGSENETNSSGNYPLGMPLGGIGAGNFNFLPNGTYNQDFIEISSDNTAYPTCMAFEKRGTTVFSAPTLGNTGSMTTTFTGYWPTVFMGYQQTGMLDSIALKCFSPIVTGAGIASDNLNSSLPIAFYKFTLTNNSTSTDTAAIALSNGANSSSVLVNGRVAGIKGSTVCVMVDTAKLNAADSITCGTSTTTFTTTGMLNNTGAGVLAKRVIVGPSSSRTITFCVSWTNVTNGYYTNYFTSAQAIATYGIDSAAVLEALVDNWHNKILNSNLPSWLQDLAINCLHVYNCMTQWTTTSQNGVTGYGMAESMSSGNFGTNDQAYHAHFALSCFAPQAEWSQVTNMTTAQLSNGLFGHLYGDNSAGDLRVDVGPKFVLETYKTYQWTGNTTQLKALYTNMANAITGMGTLTTATSDGIPDDNDFTTFDNPQSDGWVIPSKEYEADLYLSAVKAMVNVAGVAGTAAEATTYQTTFNTVSTAFERSNNATFASSGFWDSTDASYQGKLGYYTASTDMATSSVTGTKAATGTIGKAVWDEGLIGQWCADVCGLGPLHPESRIESTLNFTSDACLDHSNPPSYSLMMAMPTVNTSTTPPTGTFFDGEDGYCTYCSYGAGGLCNAFQHNLPDVSMRALQALWNDMFSKYLRVYNMPCKMTVAGNGTDWGLDRYMNPPACFGALFGITGFTIDVNAKALRIKPSLPTSAQYAMDSLVSGPLINPISCGTVDYKKVTTSTPNYQRFVIRFDNPMQFNTFYTKKLFSSAVAVVKPAAGGTTVAATIAENSADTSEYQITFGSTLTIDNTGVLIEVGTSNAAIDHFAPPAKSVFGIAVNMKSGMISYILPQPNNVAVTLVNPKGESFTLLRGEMAAGSHALFHNWTKEPTGVYFLKIRSGEMQETKEVVNVR
jgi:uncharacterized protein (DUF608 family)